MPGTAAKKYEEGIFMKKIVKGRGKTIATIRGRNFRHASRLNCIIFGVILQLLIILINISVTNNWFYSFILH